MFSNGKEEGKIDWYAVFVYVALLAAILYTLNDITGVVKTPVERRIENNYVTKVITVEGPRGPTGRQGERGPRGPRGKSSGKAGPRGAVGPQGSRGRDGQRGATGPRGPAGVPGLPGPQGVPGVAPTLREILDALLCVLQGRCKR